MIVVVATKEELVLAKNLFAKTKIIQTGVGYGNVYRALRHLKRNTKILNFGYAGSNTLTKGHYYRVSISENYHPNVEIDEKTYRLCDHGFKCFTSNDFVIQTNIQEPVLFDMELYAIMSMGFKNVQSIKVVSDNLNLNEYEEEIHND